MTLPLVLALLLGETLRPGIVVKDENVLKGRATTVNCTGSGIACGVLNGLWTLDGSGGGGGAPTDAYYVTTAAHAGLSNEVVLPTCAGTTKLTFNGSAISCATDQDTLPPSLPLSAANGGLGQAQPTCTGTQKLTCGGTTCTCAADQDTIYSLPAASTTLGGTKMAAACGAGNHVSSIGAGGELTCSADAAYTLPAATSTVLGGVKGTGTAIVCSGTDKATGWAADGTLQCGTDQTTGGGAYGTIQEEGTGLTQRAILNFVGSSITCADDTTRTTCTLTAGGLSGLTSGAMMYANSTTTETSQASAGTAGQLLATGGAGAAPVWSTNVKSITGNLTLVGVATPSTPAAGEMVLYGKPRAGRIILTGISPDGNQYTMQESLFSNHIQIMKPNTGTTVPIEFGNTWTGRASTGTLGTPTPAATNRYTKMRRMEFTSGTTAGYGYGIQGAQAINFLGNAANDGGFFFFARFGWTTLNAGSRLFIGLTTQNAAYGATEPSTINNTVGLGKDSGDANASFFMRGTAVTKNSSFTPAANTIYDFTMSAPPNSTTITYRLVDETNGTVIWDNLAVSTNAPAVNTLMYPWAWVGTSTTSTQVLGINKVYIASDF